MTGITANAPLLFSIIAFIVLALFLLGIIQYFQVQSRKKEIKEKIRQGEKPPPLPPIGGKSEEKRGFLGLFQSVGTRMAPQQDKGYSEQRLKFLRAGLRDPHAPTVFWGAKISLMVLFALCFLVLRVSVFKMLETQMTLFLCVLAAAVGFYLPDIWLRIKQARRKRLMFEGFPDALDLLVVCVEAGMGLDAAIARVGEEIRLSNRVLSDELKQVNLEIRAGKPRGEALRHLAMRVNLEDVSNLATLMIQTDRFGTSIAQALRVYSDTFRTKRFQMAEEIAAKLPVKLVFPLILFIFPSLFVVIAGPIVIRFIKVFMPTFGQ